MLDGSPKLRAFVSYSRKDGLDFVEQLAAALEAAGIDPMIDRHDIAGGEDWKKRIGNLIAAADSVVFAITPQSIASEICEWEIAMSDQLGKKLIPIVPAPLEGVSPPARLSNLNYIFFCSDPDIPGAGFGQGLADLCNALRTDLDWVRAHTRYGRRAAEWLFAKRADSRLLWGDDVVAAKTWMENRQPGAPQITDDMREFIKASEQGIERRRLQQKEAALEMTRAAQEMTKIEQEKTAQAQRLRRTIIILGLLCVLAGAAIVFAMWQQAANAQRRAEGLSDLLGWVGHKDLDADRKVTSAQIETMSDLCDEAIAVTEALSNRTDPAADQENNAKFWDLYYGSLYVVEEFQNYHFQEPHFSKNTRIESKMVQFGNILKSYRGTLPSRDEKFVNAAKGVKDACTTFQNWHQVLDGKREPTNTHVRLMVDLCNGAIAETQALASNTDYPAEHSKRKDYWDQYKGSLYVVEQFENHRYPDDEPPEEVLTIERSMVNFGKVLNGESGTLPAYDDNLAAAAKGVEDACTAFQQWLKTIDTSNTN